MARFAAAAALGVAALCAPGVGAHAQQPPKPPAAEAFGVATMQADGTLVLRLRSDGPHGERGEQEVVYKPDNPRYHAILAHVGDIKPGEKKKIAPWSNHPER